MTARQKQRARVNVFAVIDRSGSMSSCIDQTIDGFNSYVERLKSDRKTDYFMTLTMFDDVIEHPLRSVPIKEVPAMTALHGGKLVFSPRGSTALYDAIGDTVKEARQELATIESSNILMVMTDGHENASKRWNKSQVKCLVEELNEDERWTAVFLGTELNTMDEASQVGFYSGNTGHYHLHNTSSVYSRIADATVTFASTAAPVNDNLTGKMVMRSAASSTLVKDHLKDLVETKS